MEIVDVVNEYGEPTGERVSRKQAHEEGIRHRTAHVWVLRRLGKRIEVLLQKRSMEKESFPERFDTSSAGHIQAGDEPLESALRELHEELGIAADPKDIDFADTFRIQYEKKFFGKLFKDNEVAFVHVYEKPVDVKNLTLQEEEVDSVEWFDLEYVYEQCKAHNEKFCVPIGGLEVIKRYVEK